MKDLSPRAPRLGFGAMPIASVALALAAFLLLRPYEGIVHDARLYVGYALAPLDPAGIGQDIMFTLDGQASKTLYPAMLRSLAQAIGLTPALLTLTYGALILWFIAAWRLVRVVARESLNPVSIAAVVVLLGSLHTFYGGASTIRFAEPFAAPRALAEALGMFAIVQAIGRRWWSVLLLVVVGVVVHPIMTAPVIAVMVIMAAPHDRMRAQLLGGGLAIGVLLAIVAARVSSGGLLLGRFDETWMGVLDHFHSLVLLRYWSGVDLARVVLQLITLAIARRCVRPSAQSLVDGVILVSVAGLILSLVGVDLLSHRLIGQAQPWRALWLAGVMASIGLALVVQFVGAPNSNTDGRDDQAMIRRKLSAILLVAAWMLLTFTPMVAVLAVMAWWLWVWPDVLRPSVANRTTLQFPRIAPLALGFALLIGVVGYVVLQAVITWQVLGAAPATAIPSQWLIWFRSGVPAVLVCVSALWILVRQPPSRELRAAVNARRALAIGALILVVLLGDQRTAYARALEDGLGRPFASEALQRNASVDRGSVAWPGAEVESWALLGRPSWGTVNQGVAKVFSRSLALQWAPRFEALLDTTAPRVAGAAQQRMQRRVLDQPQLQRICRMPDAPSAVVVVLPTELTLPGVSVRLTASRFEPPSTPQGTWRTIDSVRLVSCAAIEEPLLR